MSTDESSIDTKSVSTNTDDVLKLVDERISTAISTLSLQTLDTNVSMDTDEILSLIDSKISTAISTLSLLTAEDVSTAISTAISTALVPLQDEISEVAEFSRNLQGEMKQAPTNRIVDPENRSIRDSQTEAKKSPEAIDLNTAITASFAEFYAAVGLEVPTGRLKADAQPALEKAIELGFENWRYDGKRKNLERKIS